MTVSTAAPDPDAPKPIAGIFLITPETATRWLQRNVRNRVLNDGVVKRYAEDMASGRWHLTGAPIQFDQDGNLLDGQHRLAAVARSGIPLPLFIVRGLDNHAQDYMDTGRKRTVGDQLAIAGYKHSSVVAAAGRLALLWSTERLGRGALVSDAELRQFIEDEPSLVTASDVAATVYRRGLDISPSVVGACFWKLLKEGNAPETVAAWFLALAEMRTTGSGDPKLALLNRFATARRNRERLSQEVQLGLVVRAWNADSQNKPMYKMPYVSRAGLVSVPPVRRWAA